MAKKFTFKQEMIQTIGVAMKNSTLPPLPLQCLEDMSTASLVAFEKWIQMIIQSNQKTPSTHQLTSGK